MGNQTSREARGLDSTTAQNRQRPVSSGGTPTRPISPSGRQHGALYGARPGGRSSRPDLSMFGIGSGTNTSEVPERRETKQEREARKLEKERVARVKERERSIKEEHVDGGYLVTMGVYTGTEDFNKAIVRQLMIERRIAPFWRGLNDFKEEWTEHQLVAAGRGLPIPAADEIPQDEPTVPAPSESANASNANLQSLMPPISSRSQTVASDGSTSLSVPAPLSEPSSPSTAAPANQSSSPFRPRTRILASLTTSSKSPSVVDIVPREIQLPNDPYVNGQALEAFLYKDATECPICFLYYPPYLNKTRCCDQPICSECFVQIKRPDPHPPEHENNDTSQTPSPEASAETETLVSEPACCPYCQVPEFGVTYQPPSFKRGLSYANPQGVETPPSGLQSSSTTNVTDASNSTLAPRANKRRTTSISASAPTVIATDKIRPDWAVKLANARSHMARRSAAATALHTAAYLMGNGNNDSRGFGFGSRSRFGRSRGENSPAASGTATPSAESVPRSVAEQIAQIRREAQEARGTRQHGRIDDLEEMMVIEAIKLSLATEEDRRRKVEREAAKDARKRAKEERKREKKEKKGVYGSGPSSAGGSTLSLSLSGFGRRRGNSAGSTLAKEVTSENVVESKSKGKEVDRGVRGAASINTAVGEASTSKHGSTEPRSPGNGSFPSLLDSHDSPTVAVPERSSHLRQMSNASSLTSSFGESTPGSPQDAAPGAGSWSNPPNTSGVGSTGNTNESADTSANTSFNLQSLAAVINYGNEDTTPGGQHTTLSNIGSSNPLVGATESLLAPSLMGGAVTVADDNPSSGEHHTETPELIITPGTPAPVNEVEEYGKQLGVDMNGSA